jgi:hypothetical protein
VGEGWALLVGQFMHAALPAVEGEGLAVT